MTEIEIFIDDVNEVYPILDALKNAGLVMNNDFQWSYKPVTWDGFASVNSDNRSLIFSFKEAATATWFAVKYSK